MTFQRRWVLGIVFGLGACTTTFDESEALQRAPLVREQPFVVVLGTAQDGGLPQLACREALCERARREPEYRRLVASLLIVDPRTQRRWLIDATPELPEQVELAEAVAPRPARSGRPALFDGIFLTHAHFGHYTGLAALGREVYGSERTTVWASERMKRFLESNGPWDLLQSAGHITVQAIHPGHAIELAPDLSIVPFLVPHRDEYSDTLGFRIEGPERALVYIPDIDKWSRFEPGLESTLESCDLALIDGSFFEDGEIPGRAMADIPHPFIRESLALLATQPAPERAKVYFTHLNHTNPATDPGGPAAAAIRSAGSQVARDGQMFDL